MAQSFYTLQEAAQVLGMNVDELKGLAQKQQIRSFQDRGTLRFRLQDIEELKRQRANSSDPELVLGDAISPKPASATAPKSGILKTPKPGSNVKGADVFDFELNDSVDIGMEPLPAGGSAGRLAGPRSGAGKSAPKTPKHGSDSDVKLVADGSESFSIELGGAPKPSVGDSDVRLGELETNKKVSGGSSRKSGVGRRSSKLGPSPEDSGVRLVPMEGSGLRLDAVDTGASESGVRLSNAPPARRSAESASRTEEINLDEEIETLEAAALKKTPETKFKTTPAMVGKPGAPFELSEHDIDDKPTRAADSSGDFEIAAGPKSSPPKSSPKSPRPKPKKSTEFELTPSGDQDEDFSLELDDESLDLGSDPSTAAFESPKSGINLSRPSDKGISLESPAAGEDFELSLEDGPSTPRPTSEHGDEGDSDFELTLDDSSSETPALSADSTDSEFELSLDGGSTDEGSDFEIALDDDQPAAKNKPKKKAVKAEERDIFDTDFELPGVEEGSSDDTADGGSSDFELALDDSDIAPEDESGSQVVALDEEEYEDAGETMDGDIEEFEEGDIEEEAEVREKIVVQEVVRDRWIKPAPWGVLPVVFLFPCAVVLILVGIMGWELVQTTSGFKASGLLTRSMAEMMNVKLR